MSVSSAANSARSVQVSLGRAAVPDERYDLVLARTFAMPGLPVNPGTVTPAGSALSKARVLPGEQAMRRIF